ncbi:MAG: DNA primase [Patescibacteria group bacterium]|jgi:DNA primase
MAQDNIEEIKSKIDVVDLIQEYIQVKPAGANSFRALCPFHHEKTPSFMVSRDKQIWHCFGCAEGGDIFGFVMKMEGLEFPEALRILAKKAGVQLKYQDPAQSNQKTRLMEICKSAAFFFHKILLDHPKAEFVREYLKKRKVQEQTTEAWQLGYAPDAWETLNTYLTGKGFKEDDIFLAGLTIKKDRSVGYIDRFRHRLMFPIWDIHGNVIGFGGRWLGAENDKMAKYINTPQTDIYNKSQVLYGIDKARQEIKKQKLAVIVEGYMDCLASHQAGVINVVASSGTALTLEQVKLLKRYTTNLAFAFDQDLAGDSAAKRGIEIAWQEEMNTKIIQLPQGKDPDELLKIEPAAWPRAIVQAQSVMEYYFQKTFSKLDLKSVDNKKETARILLPVIAKLSDTIEQSHYVQKLAGLLNVEESVIRDKLKRMQLQKSGKADQQASEPAYQSKDRFIALSENIIGTVLKDNEKFDVIAEQLLPEHVPLEKLSRLYKLMLIYYTKNQAFNYKEFISSIPQADKELATYAEILSLKAEQDNGEASEDFVIQEIRSGVHQVARNHLQKSLKGIEEALRQAEKSNNKQKAEQLNRDFSDKISELKQLDNE